MEHTAAPDTGLETLRAVVAVVATAVAHRLSRKYRQPLEKEFAVTEATGRTVVRCLLGNSSSMVDMVVLVVLLVAVAAVLVAFVVVANVVAVAVVALALVELTMFYDDPIVVVVAAAVAAVDLRSTDN
jgi:hypothetical protein